MGRCWCRFSKWTAQRLMYHNLTFINNYHLFVRNGKVCQYLFHRDGIHLANRRTASLLKSVNHYISIMDVHASQIQPYCNLCGVNNHLTSALDTVNLWDVIHVGILDIRRRFVHCITDGLVKRRMPIKLTVIKMIYTVYLRSSTFQFIIILIH